MRRWVTVSLLAALVSGVAAWSAIATPARAVTRDVDAFRGLGAWIDVFDYVPVFKQQPGPSPVNADTIHDLALLGAKTIYLQAAIDDPRASGLVVDRSRVGSLLQRAHDQGLRAVAWYYPQLVEPERDRRRLEALLDFRAGGDRFDAIALDIESTQVPDIADRSKRLVKLVGQIRKKAGGRAIGAIVFPAVQLEVINPLLWPDFPYRKLKKDIDAWLPMAYWTFRDGAYRDAFTYTEESVRRLRRDLGDRNAVVHTIGGLGASSATADYQGLVKAARHVKAVGWSIYDADTTATTAWRLLRDHSS
jgi:hypothetical protein